MANVWYFVGVVQDETFEGAKGTSGVYALHYYSGAGHMMAKQLLASVR